MAFWTLGLDLGVSSLGPWPCIHWVVVCSIGKNMDSNTADDHCCQQNYKLQYDLQVATSHGETVWDFQS